MRAKQKGLLTLLLALVMGFTYAQEKTITGTVTDQSDLPLPGVNILVQGTTNGTQTDFDGNYSIEAEEGQILMFTYIGQAEVTQTVGAGNTIDVQMEEDAQALDEVVVTALGIEREKKSLGYATQEIDGDQVSDVPVTNFVNSLSGKVAGVSIKNSGTLGGSSNVVIRGSSSLTGNNQALFIIDGTPIGNATDNTTDQRTGRGGYDYGNAAQDINPANIASINVLKGAAATALYGARAANGAIIIETKKGSKGKGIGVSISSTVTTSTADRKTLPKYQQEYGAGYGAYYESDDGYFALFDVDGDGIAEETTPFTEDASFGGRFDPNRLIYQWNSIYPQLDTYLQPQPWTAGKHTPNDIWRMGVTSITNIGIDGGTERSSFRLSANHLNSEGALPNSLIKRNSLMFSSTHDFTDKLSAAANINYMRTDGQGRYGTGYDAQNVMQSFRQWWQVNNDLYELRDAYFATGENITWNSNSPENLSPIYFDNPYWALFENYQSDNRNRYFGNVNLNYKFNDVFNLLGRFSFDTYDEIREERKNVGSVDVSRYRRFNNRVSEFNYDLILGFNKNLAEELNFEGNIGINLRRNYDSYIDAQTNGGLNAPRFYALSNSSDPLEPPIEYDATSSLDGVYARASLGYKGTYYLEGTIRRDRSSTLPKANNTFLYPSISGNIILSNLIGAEWLSFTKLRANYAEVGNDTQPYRVFNTYTVSTPFAGNGIASNNLRLANLNLKPERAKSYEVGIEANLFQRRLSLDLSYYRTRTEDQITPVPVSNATGFDEVLLNAGTIENKGLEVSLTVTPIATEDFNWDATFNWSNNKSEVLELTDGINNLELASFQGGVSINAAPGEPYGAIRGSDYIYTEDGTRVVGDNGYYLTSSTSNNILGDIQPDWIGGVQNSFRYKNVSLSFLVDIQNGGDIFSLDTWYGFATGLYDRTVGLNELGNPIRNPLSDDPATTGGVILPGVTGTVTYADDGSYTVTDTAPNSARARTDYFGNPFGYARDANKGHVYDASFVKLREVSLEYRFSDKILDQLPFTQASISFVGRNLWIIHKNIPYSDPEAGLSAGNFQGYQSGAYPNFREIGASVKFNF